MAKKRKLMPTPTRVKIEVKEENALLGIGTGVDCDMAGLDGLSTCLGSPGGDDVLNARHRLKGVLQELLDQSDDDSVSSTDDTTQSSVFSRQSPIKKEPVAVPVQAVRNFRQQRKRRRREAVNEGAFHHTYVMKLFDRSVDLAQFNEDTPLYPVCRAWMANQPRNTNLVPKMRTPTPEPPPDDTEGDCSSGGETDSEVVRDTYKMPPPEPLVLNPEQHLSPRIPSPIFQERQDIILDYDVKPPVSRETLLQNHLTHWSAVRKKWHSTSHSNEARYGESCRILRAIYKKAQKAFE